MTGDLLIDSAISLAGVALIVLLVRWLMPAKTPPLTAGEAQARLSLDEPDFTPRDWLIDAGGRMALAEGEGGEFVFVERFGLDLVIRRFSAGGVKTAVSDGVLSLNFSDPGMPVVRFAHDEAAQWARKLSPGDDI